MDRNTDRPDRAQRRGRAGCFARCGSGPGRHDGRDRRLDCRIDGRKHGIDQLRG